MQTADKFFTVNIRRYLEREDDFEAGKPALVKTLMEYSCPQNPDVERFLQKSAIEFTRKNQSVTYLVFSKKNGELVGYFTLALKPLTVRGETVSNRTKRKLLRVSELDEQSQTYTMSAYLIAQLGRNFTQGLDENITGAELLELAWSEIESTQYKCGGMVVFLEAENHVKLKSFYEANRFQSFDTRQISSSEEKHELVQFLRLL
jgi:hypothetical protein